jgi:hypothetical protein
MHDMPRDDHEAEMAKSELYRAAKYAMKLHEMIQAGDELEGWTQSKITKASDYLASVFHYLDYELKFKHGGDNKMDMMPMGGEPQEKMAFSLAEKLEMAMRRDKHQAIIAEAKKKDKKVKEDPNEGNAFGKAVSDAKKDGVQKGEKIKVGGNEYPVKEALKGKQKNLDVDNDGDIEGDDLADLRAGKKPKAKDEKVKEGAMSNLDADRKDRQYQSRQAKTTMKHIKNPTAGEKAAAKDIKPGIKGYQDRVAMLKSAEKDGRLKDSKVKEGWDDMVKATKEKDKGTGKFDVKKTGSGTQYTRKASTYSDGGDDSDTKKAKAKAKKD